MRESVSGRKPNLLLSPSNVKKAKSCLETANRANLQSLITYTNSSHISSLHKR